MAKILRSYLCLSYVFSVILYLNTYFCSPISDLCNWCERRRKRAIFGSILEHRLAVHKDGWNVATLQRRDVPKS